jgi:hypothetical protein
MILPAVRQNLKSTTTDDEYQVLMQLAETGVRWARQWMQTATGEEKKTEVSGYLQEKAAALGLIVGEDDIDKAIEAVYDKIKQETE